jgi:hypothetical protein
VRHGSLQSSCIKPWTWNTQARDVEHPGDLGLIDEGLAEAIFGSLIMLPSSQPEVCHGFPFRAPASGMDVKRPGDLGLIDEGLAEAIFWSLTFGRRS